MKMKCKYRQHNRMTRGGRLNWAGGLGGQIHRLCIKQTAAE